MRPSDGCVDGSGKGVRAGMTHEKRVRRRYPPGNENNVDWSLLSNLFSREEFRQSIPIHLDPHRGRASRRVFQFGRAA